MKNIVSIWTSCIALSLLLHSPQSLAINRCVIDGKTVYQDQPCPGTLGTVGEEIKAKEDRRRWEEQQKAEQAARRKKYEEEAYAEQLSRQYLVDRMTTYAVLLGRGIACEAPGVQEASRKVGAWMEEKGLAKTYTVAVAEGIRMSAIEQRAGRSPDSCAIVRTSFPTYPWP